MHIYYRVGQDEMKEEEKKTPQKTFLASTFEMKSTSSLQ